MMFSCDVWKKRNEPQNIGGVSIRWNGAPSGKGGVVDGQTTKACNK